MTTLMTTLKILLGVMTSVRFCICEEGDAPLYESTEWEAKSAEQRLLYDLLLYYEPSTRPVRDARKNVTVKIGLVLGYIFELNEKTQTMTTNVWFNQEWTDEMLKWNPNEYGIHNIRIPDTKIWVPDTVLYNSASGETKGFMRINAMVNYDGNVFWSPACKLIVSCKIDITYFPFDYQRCYFKFGSWAYHGYEVDVVGQAKNIDLSNYVENGEFELISTSQKQLIIQYPCCPEPYPHMLFVLQLRRKTLYHTYTVIVPCFIMSALSFVVFMLPPDAGEKISLGISVFLTFSVYVMMIAEKVPETSDACPLISIYLSVAMTTTGVSTLMTVMVLNVHHMQNQAVPPWIKKFVLQKLRKLLCISAKTEAIRKCSSYKKISSFSAIGKLFSMAPFGPKSTRAGKKAVKVGPAVQLLRMIRENATRNHFATESAEGFSNQWKLVAVVIDRLLFVVFFVMSIFVTLTFIAAVTYIEMNRSNVTDADILNFI